MCAYGDDGSRDRQRAAYDAAAEMARRKIERDAPRDAEALKRVAASDIVVARGSYDHVELVLQALELPFTTVNTDQVEHLSLRPDQLLVVNCPGNVSSGAVPVIRRFVSSLIPLPYAPLKCPFHHQMVLR